MFVCHSVCFNFCNRIHNTTFIGLSQIHTQFVRREQIACRSRLPRHRTSREKFRCLMALWLWHRSSYFFQFRLFFFHSRILVAYAMPINQIPLMTQINISSFVRQIHHSARNQTNYSVNMKHSFSQAAELSFVLCTRRIPAINILADRRVSQTTEWLVSLLCDHAYLFHGYVMLNHGKWDTEGMS